MQSSRRQFIFATAAAAASASLLTLATTARAAELAETDPMAVSLGYKADASKVDKAKYPAYVAGSHCGTCQLFQGKPGAPEGPCPIFSGKDVKVTGWCSAYSKKA